jgi:hypothetical protein
MKMPKRSSKKHFKKKQKNYPNQPLLKEILMKTCSSKNKMMGKNFDFSD